MSAGTRLADVSRPADVSRLTSVLVDSRCTACGACLITCPTEALVAAPGRPRVIDDRCTSCGDCIDICPRGAVTDLVLGPPTGVGNP